MGWMPIPQGPPPFMAGSVRPPPRIRRRIQTRAMPNREMIGSSTESKNWQVGRQAWDSVQRQGYLHGKEMPVLDFLNIGGEARAAQFGNVGGMALSPGAASRVMSADPRARNFALQILLHEFAHGGQPRRPPPSRSAAADEQVWKRREGGAEAFAQLLAGSTQRDLGRKQTPFRTGPRAYSQAQREFLRRHDRSHVLYGQFGLKDPRRPLRP